MTYVKKLVYGAMIVTSLSSMPDGAYGNPNFFGGRAPKMDKTVAYDNFNIQNEINSRDVLRITVTGVTSWYHLCTALKPYVKSGHVTRVFLKKEGHNNDQELTDTIKTKECELDKLNVKKDYLVILNTNMAPTKFQVPPRP